VSASVLISPTDIDCSESIPQTLVHFSINPISGGEITVNDHGLDRKFDALGSYEEAPLKGHFPNGDYEGRLTALPGYVVLPGTEVIAFSVNSCKNDPPPPSPTPLPTPTPAPITDVPTTTVESVPVQVPRVTPPPAPKVDSPPSIAPPAPESPTESIPTTTEESITTANPLEACGSEEECKQVCEEIDSGCVSYTTELMLEKPANQGGGPSSFVPEVESVENYMEERGGVRVFADADGDGIVDFDEVNIFGTDPKKADSDDDGVTDSDELVAHTDPIVLGTTTMIFQDPDQYGVVTATGTMGATAIAAGEITNDASGIPHLSSLVLSGHGPANAYVTLFIYSEPIVVTVRTDRSGVWTYHLNKELPDGSHKVYTALTDNGGRVIAKSEPLPFVKEAGAVSIGGAFLPTVEQAPSFFGGMGMVVMVSLLAIVLLVSVIVLGIFVRTKSEETSGTGTV
jgi:hypothetical protein